MVGLNLCIYNFVDFVKILYSAHKMVNAKLTFKLMSFEGDPTFVDYFFSQIGILAKPHKLKDEESIQF